MHRRERKRIRPVRRNSDRALRDLERRFFSGDRSVSIPLFRLALRAGDYGLAAEALLAMGSLRANELLNETFPVRDEGDSVIVPPGRDRVVLELGSRLVKLGWQPNLPVPGREGCSSKRSWEIGPKLIRGRFGSAKCHRIYVLAEFHAPHTQQPRNENSPSAPHLCSAPYLWLDWDKGKLKEDIPWEVKGHLVDIGKAGSLCAAVPEICYLARWDYSYLTGRNTGFKIRYPACPIYFFEYEDWPNFEGSALIGLIPGEEPPPKGLSHEEIVAWLERPGRREEIKALFYGDLWLASEWIEQNAEYSQEDAHDPNPDPLPPDSRFMHPQDESLMNLRQRPGFYRNPPGY